MSDSINEPAHYMSGGMECIQIIEAMTTKMDDGFSGYCIGNITKYLYRYQDKGGLEDLMKAGNEVMAAFRREDFSAYGTDADAIRRRAVSTVESIIGAHPGQRVVVVTHGTVINAFVGSFLGSRKLVFHHPSYTGVTGVKASRRGDREITCLNDSTHLRLPWPALLEKELS